MTNNTKSGIKEFLEGMLANVQEKRFSIQQALSSEWILNFSKYYKVFPKKDNILVDSQEDHTI